MIKIFFIVVFLLIVASLGSALFHLVKPGEGEASDKTVKALTVRIVLSVILFIIMIILLATGIIEPQGIGSRIHMQKNQASENSK